MLNLQLNVKHRHIVRMVTSHSLEENAQKSVIWLFLNDILSVGMDFDIETRSLHRTLNIGIRPYLCLFVMGNVLTSGFLFILHDIQKPTYTF